ncbi:M56 family metallopeptidase [Dyadobacter subterraneus]|uniref:M48 family metalloprotease n=1 Tax=Dyadobacter subterraneus TaxID=2773304 RepID=A0ABR9WG74_9BACT|nr:M56 family metallopeptidase [Dyadobacter subterraneus]MBE9463144.1 M48 family metalloprotease [Dyadobacter subterraneus]
MKFFVLDSGFVSVIIQSICRTLLHSVWQGLILAVITGIILTSTKKSKPAVRYNLLSLSLLAFVIATSFTFYTAFDQQQKVKSFSEINNLGIVKPSQSLLETPFGTLRKISKLENIEQFSDQFLRENATVLVAIWLLIFSLKSVKALGGLLYIHRLKREDNTVPDHVWIRLISDLAVKLNIHTKIQLLESERVMVPMVAGVLKPIIFVPVSFFSLLPPAQIEAILLHELAHIKRSDYAINLIQNFCENVFFFNPAVLWISALIREEREHCCDDLAISVMENQTSFVEALVSFQEYKLADQSLAMAFPGRRNFLLDRIKRIIYKHNKPLNAMEKIFVTASLITATLMTAAFSPVVKKDLQLLKPKLERVLEVSKPESSFLPITMEDTLPKKSHSSIYSESGKSTIELTKDNKHYEIEKVNGKLTSLKINGQQISEDNMTSYKDEIDAIMLDVKREHEKADNARAEADVMRKQAEGNRKEADKMRVVADKMRAEADQSRLLANAGREKADEVRKAAESNRLEAEKQRGVADKLRGEAEVLRLQAEENRKSADELRKQAEISRKEADKARVAYEKLQNNLIEDLIKEGVVKSKNNLSYKLNSEELVVNGVKQPAALHQKIKEKYVEGPGWEVIYNFSGRTGISITK